MQHKMIKKKIFMKKACRMLDCFILKYITVLHVKIFIPKHVYPFFENFDSKNCRVTVADVATVLSSLSYQRLICAGISNTIYKLAPQPAVLETP